MKDSFRFTECLKHNRHSEVLEDTNSTILPNPHVKHLSPLHFLCTQCLQPLQNMLLLPTPVQQMAHGNSPELCRRSRPVPQDVIFVFPAFTLSPFSIASFQVKSLPTRSSRDSELVLRHRGPPRGPHSGTHVTRL